MRNWVIAGLMLAGSKCALPAVDFQRDIRPVLAKKCFAGHGPDERARQVNLRLDTFDGATGRGGGYAGIVPGSSAKSRVAARIADPKRPMPPAGEPLSAREVELVKQWIDEGASYRQHWAFEKPARPAGPSVRNSRWPRNEIDYLVLARLEKEGLAPSPEADRFTLARRVALDVTGLPPEPALVEAFVADKNPAAYEKLVDHLLASPHYGERWARVWLDLARYADTQGYEKDNRRAMWPYRDWVVKALNDNIPFDRFTLLQLAGDLLPSPSEDNLVATGFHRNTMTNTEGGTDDEEFRDAAVKDRVAVTGQVWTGLTWGCAQCHSHKYDPLSHREFYQLYAYFNQTQDHDQPDDRPTLKLAAGGTALIMRELPEAERRKTRIHERGNFLNPGAEVSPATPEAFHRFPPQAPPNRLGLAQWLVDENNPLTARVQVNRTWARLFGRGLVESEEDFGTQGTPPSQPEVLDWLATEYLRLKWDTKALLKTIVMSATYRQSSDVRGDLLEKDPYNRLLARGPRFRLDAEMVRDQALAASGLLSRKMGGPPVMPWQPEGIWQVVYNGDQWVTSKGEDRYRRGLYTFLRRTSPYPTMITYDAPTGEICTIRRVRTNTPLQALATLNDPVSMEAAQHLALRTLKEAGGSDKARAERMFRLMLVRQPSKSEVERIVALKREAEADLLRSGERGQKLLHYDQVLYVEDRDVALVADARTNPAAWRFTVSEPATGWEDSGFDASAWSTGRGPFGYFEKPGDDNKAATEWKADHLWLRTEFDAPAEPLENLRLHVRTLGGFEAYLNGAPLASTNLDRSGYYEYPLGGDAAAALKPGKNVLAIRATRLRETKYGQLIDAGLAATRRTGFGEARREDADKAAWVVVANALMNLDETLTRR